MCLSSTWCGRCLVLFFSILVVVLFWIFLSADYIRFLDDPDPPLVLETDRLPMISPDKKIIYVASEDGLPIAHNFILRNPSIPVEKIVYRKPGHNSTVHVYPIQRDALLATNHDFSKSDLPGLCAFIFMLVFTSIGMYMFMCKDFWGSNGSRSSSGSSISCDTCFEFDPTIDLLDMDDPFDTPTDSPLTSPIKSKKMKISKISDELEQPLLVV